MDVTALVQVFEGLSGRAAEMAVAALWQGALIACVLALCLRLAPRINAAYRFAVWSAAFVAVVGLSLFSLLPESTTASTNAFAAQAAQHATRPWFGAWLNGPWLNVDARWSVAIALLWLMASLFRASDLAVHSLRLRKMWKDAKPVELDSPVETLLAEAAGNCGRGQIEVCTTVTLQRPSVIGFFKPRILIPDWLFARLTPGELEQIVLHETEHLRRCDDWSNLAQKLCLALFPLNPALLWIERRLCREREMACDEGVIRITRAPRAYAACLASLAERGLERRVEALSLGAWQRRSELVHRVHSILRSKGGLSPMSARLLLGTLGCALLAGSVELAQSPQLVAFVPVHNAVTASKADNSVAATSATAEPVSVMPAEREMAGSANTRSASSRFSDTGANVSALNVTLRQSQKPSDPAANTSNRNEAPNARPLMANAMMAKTIMMKSDQPDANSTQDQQWVVLTTWEQVETSNNIAGLRADYDTDSTANQSTATPSESVQRLGGQITVTQLIFRVLPARAGLPVRAGSGSAARPAANPSTGQPGLATFHDGWLVFQL